MDWNLVLQIVGGIFAFGVIIASFFTGCGLVMSRLAKCQQDVDKVSRLMSNGNGMMVKVTRMDETLCGMDRRAAATDVAVNALTGRVTQLEVICEGHHANESH